MKDHFAGIREFVCAADGGSFVAAGMQLGVTGSAIGKAISRLEARLGVQLLHRTTRRIVLTTEGESYLRSCRRVVEELEQQELTLSSGQEQPVGQLRVDLPTTFGRRHIMPTLLELGLRSNRLDLAIGLRDRPVDLVSEGIDLAVRIGQLGDHPDLVARRLGDQTLRVCAAPSYLQKRGKPTHRSELIQHDCLIGWYRGGSPTWNLKTESGETEPFNIKPRHEIPDGDALLEACLAGGGIAQLPNWLADTAIKDGTLIHILTESDATAPIHVLWQKTWHIQSKVRVTVDALVTLAKDHPEVFAASKLLP